MEDTYYVLFRNGRIVENSYSYLSHYPATSVPGLFKTFVEARNQAIYGDSILKVRLDTIEAFTNGQGPV